MYFVTEKSIKKGREEMIGNKKPPDSPLRAIKQYCLDCSGDSANERTQCPSKECPLWPFRQGKNTLRKKRVLTEEQKIKQALRMKAARGE